MTTKAKGKTRTKKTAKVYLCRCDYGNYTLTAVAPSEDEARQAVLDSLDGPAQDAGHDSPQAMYEYMGGHVTELTQGRCEWL